MSRNILAELKSLRTTAQAGGFSASKKEAVKQTVLAAIGHEERMVVQTTARFAFARWFTMDLISAPIATTAAIFVFVLGGWLTTVNAASTSLPGDTLYGLKLVTEQAQLQLASLEDRAVLHTEFAQRRLSEAVAIGNSQNPEKDTYVSSTLQAYKQQMSLAQGDLRELSQSGSDQTAQIASAIDQSITQLNNVIDASIVSSSNTESQVVSATEVKDATDAASQTVVDVLVDTHDAEPGTTHVIDIQKVFRDALADVEKRQTFDLGRIAKIRTALAAHPTIDQTNLPQEKTLVSFEREITAVTVGVPDAMDALAAGGSRTAFDSLASMKANLKEIESRIAAQEILVTQAIAGETK